MGQVVYQATYLSVSVNENLLNKSCSTFTHNATPHDTVLCFCALTKHSKILLPYPELTCQLMRVDKFSTVIRQGVLTGGPYLTIAQTRPYSYLLFSYLIEGLEGDREESADQGEISFYEFHLETLIF